MRNKVPWHRFHLMFLVEYPHSRDESLIAFSISYNNNIARAFEIKNLA